MFYRYEIRKDKDLEWEGVFSCFDPDQRRFWSRLLRDPAWYRTHEDTPSRCQFTEYGYNKYHEIMDEMVEDLLYYRPAVECRILKENELSNIVSRGKVQCIEQLELQASLRAS